MKPVIGVDIGGTFTDCVVLVPGRAATMAKAATTPESFDRGFFAAIDRAAAAAGLEPGELVASAQGIYHGCTVGTNALVEGETAPVALLTTRGHADSLSFMQAGRRLRAMPPEYVAHVAGHRKPPPLVARELVVEVDERVGADGAVVAELDEEGARQAIEGLLGRGIAAFAVSLIWATANPKHEHRLRELIAAAAPGAYVSLSSQIAPRTGEYERTVATVINSLIGAPMDSYLGRVEERLRELGFSRELQVMTCGGGLVPAAEARRTPVATIGSGPVAGVIGATALAASAGAAITADMGGTTLDVGVIDRSEPTRRPTARHGQYEYYVPTVDVRSVGAGGGSIVRFEPSDGTLRVGPQSAGAEPGPACYGRGGSAATVSDADLLLGYLEPAGFAGAGLALDAAAAEHALAAVGAPLGYDAHATAAAAVRIVDAQMADAIRLATLQQGHDPRDFSLVVYGGAGAVHGAAIAAELGIERIVIPLSDLAAGWSAYGVAGSEALMAEDEAVSMQAPFEPERLNDCWRRLEMAATARFAEQGVDGGAIWIKRLADMRYPLQVNQVQVTAPDGAYGEQEVAALIDAYEREYARLFGAGAGYAEAGYAITALRIEARAQIAECGALAAPAASDAAPAPRETRPVTFVGDEATTLPTAVYAGSALQAGARLEGPAVLAFANTSVVVPPGAVASRDEEGSVVVELGGRR